MTTEDIRAHPLSKATWVDPKRTVDTVKGMESLTRYLTEVFPACAFQYYARHPRAWHVS